MTLTDTDAATTPLGLRERKKQRTERELRAAALQLFSERGFDHVTTDDIAAAAEVSKTTFYRYFESKEHVLLGNSAEWLETITRVLAEQPRDEPVLSALRNSITYISTLYELDRETVLLKAKVVREAPSLVARNLEQQAKWEAIVADFIASRLPHRPNNEFRARVVAAQVMATMRAALQQWLDTNGRDNLADLVDEAMATLTDGPEAFLGGTTKKRRRTH